MDFRRKMQAVLVRALQETEFTSLRRVRDFVDVDDDDDTANEGFANSHPTAP